MNAQTNKETMVQLITTELLEENRRVTGLLNFILEDNKRLSAEIASMKECFKVTEATRDNYRRLYEEAVGHV